MTAASFTVFFNYYYLFDVSPHTTHVKKDIMKMRRDNCVNIDPYRRHNIEMGDLLVYSSPKGTSN